MIRYLQDCVLAFLQRRCPHPGEMVAVDILEGDARELEIAYCRRCGSVKISRDGKQSTWRRPDPHLWRG